MKAKTNPLQKRKNNDIADIIKVTVENVRRRTHIVVETCILSTIYVVLSDKFGFTKDDIRKLRDEVDNLSDSINKGYVKYSDLINTCDDELGMKFNEEQIAEIKNLSA